MPRGIQVLEAVLGPGRRTLNVILRHAPRFIAEELHVTISMSGPFSSAMEPIAPSAVDQWHQELAGLPTQTDDDLAINFSEPPPDTETSTVIPVRMRCTCGTGEVRLHIAEHDAHITVPVRVLHPTTPEAATAPESVLYEVALEPLCRRHPPIRVIRPQGDDILGR